MLVKESYLGILETRTIDIKLHLGGMAYAPAVWLAVQEHVLRTANDNTNVNVTKYSQGRTNVNVTQRLLDQLDDAFLFNNFHFNRQSLTFIADLIRTSIDNDGNKDSQQVDAMVLVALYFYANGTLSRKITDLVGLDKTAATDAVKTVSRLLAGLAEKFITFPGSHNDRVCVAQGIKDLCRIPNAVGVLGCMHIKVTPPAENLALYKNSLDYNSVMVQTICDVNGNLLAVEKCCPGGTPAQQIWEKSVIFQHFKQGYNGPTWVIGGQGYQLSTYILPPKHPSKVKNAASLSYNKAHHKALSCSLRTIGSIKNRFRCLEDLGQVYSGTLDHIARVIYACCVLHNIGKKFSVPLPRELVPEPLHLVPFAAEMPDSATTISEAEIIQDDMIITCFHSPSDEPSQAAEAGLQGGCWEDDDDDDEEEGSPERGQHGSETLQTQEQES
ncbi:putative nuclease HARBI1 [Alosa sapidissima]|uniref:putative nuclease HARBI1 n=1 Tax=Alosa sapidissima TaxID=34773 RepID=UPI001C094725|nr:putative nuclease HARBI1 [Alosa sapidissima]